MGARALAEGSAYSALACASRVLAASIARTCTLQPLASRSQLPRQRWKIRSSHAVVVVWSSTGPAPIVRAASVAFLQIGLSPPAALESRTAEQEAAGLPPARVWPATTSRPSAVDGSAGGVAKASSVTSGSAASAVTVVTPSAACLSGCSSRGVCFYGRCICDPGWLGDECAREAACDADCHGHGVCGRGVCFCDPGWTGPTCAELVPCPAGCSGHGKCSLGKCYCSDGWRGADCATATAAAQSTGIGLGSALLLLAAVTIVGGLMGYGVKAAIEQRQRAKMREILQQEAQRPFSSGLPG